MYTTRIYIIFIQWKHYILIIVVWLETHLGSLHTEERCSMEEIVETWIISCHSKTMECFQSLWFGHTLFNLPLHYAQYIRYHYVMATKLLVHFLWHQNCTGLIVASNNHGNDNKNPILGWASVSHSWSFEDFGSKQDSNTFELLWYVWCFDIWPDGI